MERGGGETRMRADGRGRWVTPGVALALLLVGGCSPADPEAVPEAVRPAADATAADATEPEQAADTEPDAPQAPDVADPAPDPPELPPLAKPTGEEICRLIVQAYRRDVGDADDAMGLRDWVATQRRTRVEGEQWIYELQYSRSGDGALPGDARDEVHVDHGPAWIVVAFGGGGSTQGLSTRVTHRSSFSWRVVATPIDPHHRDSAEEFSRGFVDLSSNFRDWR